MYFNNSYSERSKPASQAIQDLESMLAEQAFQFEIELLGNGIETPVCIFRDRYDRVVTGSGKGLGTQALASAMFEAWEHYCHQFLFNSKFDSSLRLELNGQDSFLNDGMPNFRLFPQSLRIEFSRKRFKSLFTNKEIQVPAFMLNPDFRSPNSDEAEYLNKTNLLKYSSNSGVASGSNRNEAILHGLLEVIERDAIGIEILKTIISTTPVPVRIVNKNSLPEFLSDVIKNAQEECSSEITIFNITTDIGVPVYLCRNKSLSTNDQWFGSGASLVSSEAVIRSVLESVQTFHLVGYKGGRSNYDDIICRHQRTNYQKCLMDYGIFDYQGGEVNINFPVETNVFNYDEFSKIKWLGNKLEKHGVDVYINDIHEKFPYVVQVFSPNLDRFFLACAGVMVLPGARGRDAINGLL